MNYVFNKSAFSNTVSQKYIIKPTTLFDVDTINTDLLKNMDPIIQAIRTETSPCDQKLLIRELFLLILKTDVPVQFKNIYISLAKMIEMYSLLEDKITSCIVFSMIRARY